MSMILHLWREAGAGGDPVAWWGGLSRQGQLLLLADARFRDRAIKRATADAARRRGR